MRKCFVDLHARDAETSRRVFNLWLHTSFKHARKARVRGLDWMTLANTIMLGKRSPSGFYEMDDAADVRINATLGLWTWAHNLERNRIV